MGFLCRELWRCVGCWLLVRVVRMGLRRVGGIVVGKMNDGVLIFFEGRGSVVAFTFYK